MWLKDRCKLGSFVGTEVIKVGSVVGSNMRLKEGFKLGKCGLLEETFKIEKTV